MRAAGFSAIELVTLELRSDAPSARDVAMAYCQGTPLRNEIEARDPAALEAATARAAEALARAFGEGPVSGKIQGHVITARG